MIRIAAAAAGLALIAISPAAVFAAPNAQGLHTRVWDLAHLGPDGVAKCDAFREIFQQTGRLQRGDAGKLPAVWRRDLVSKLAKAKAMPPRSLTPVKCGVPL